MYESIWIETEENNNCEWMPLQVYEAHQAPVPVKLIYLDEPARKTGVYEVTGWSSEDSGTICPALYAPVSDSGQAVVHLVYGGDWGIRLRLENSQGPWSTDSTDQHGEPYLMLMDGNDIIRE